MEEDGHEYEDDGTDQPPETDGWACCGRVPDSDLHRSSSNMQKKKASNPDVDEVEAAWARRKERRPQSRPKTRPAPVVAKRVGPSPTEGIQRALAMLAETLRKYREMDGRTGTGSGSGTARWGKLNPVPRLRRRRNAQRPLQ